MVHETLVLIFAGVFVGLIKRLTVGNMIRDMLIREPPPRLPVPPKTCTSWGTRAISLPRGTGTITRTATVKERRESPTLWRRHPGFPHDSRAQDLRQRTPERWDTQCPFPRTHHSSLLCVEPSFPFSFFLETIWWESDRVRYGYDREAVQRSILIHLSSAGQSLPSLMCLQHGSICALFFTPITVPPRRFTCVPA